MPIISHNKVRLADEGTINKFVVISILGYQLQMEIGVFAKKISGTGDDFQKQFCCNWRCFPAKNLFIFEENLS